jgi:hypothetical protein
MITIVMSLWLVAAAAAAQGPVTIVLPPDVRPADVTVHYFMTGAFGGRGGQVLFPAGPSRYSIVTDVDGKPALTLKLSRSTRRHSSPVNARWWFNCRGLQRRRSRRASNCRRERTTRDFV